TNASATKCRTWYESGEPGGAGGFGGGAWIDGGARAGTAGAGPLFARAGLGRRRAHAHADPSRHWRAVVDAGGAGGGARSLAALRDSGGLPVDSVAHHGADLLDRRGVDQLRRRSRRAAKAAAGAAR